MAEQTELEMLRARVRKLESLEAQSRAAIAELDTWKRKFQQSNDDVQRLQVEIAKLRQERDMLRLNLESEIASLRRLIDDLRRPPAEPDGE